MTAGTIRVDGIDVRDVTVDSLRGQIGLVAQEATLFGGTVRENILYGRLDATEEEMVEAAIAANAHDFISVLPDGYDTVVGDRGMRLSGGQRQRVAIARAILKDPPILLLDEATSSLDNESERLVQEALDRLKVGRTTIIVAHRLSTIRAADRIAVLDDGWLVELGTQDELLARDGLYARLHRTQFARPEDAAGAGRGLRAVPFDLERFVAAQEGVYDGALRELRGGPQDRALDLVHLSAGRRASGAARCRGSTGSRRSTEARAYLEHPVLGPRLRECVGAVLATSGVTAEQIFGSLDAMKVRSSMTLFHRAAPDEPVFRGVLDRFYSGVSDAATNALLD